MKETSCKYGTDARKPAYIYWNFICSSKMIRKCERLRILFDEQTKLVRDDYMNMHKNESNMKNQHSMQNYFLNDSINGKCLWLDKWTVKMENGKPEKNLWMIAKLVFFVLSVAFARDMQVEMVKEMIDRVTQSVSFHSIYLHVSNFPPLFSE